MDTILKEERDIEQELSQIPLFADTFPDEGTPATNVEFDALRALVHDTPLDERAENLNNSGNEAFRLGKSRWNDAVVFYSEALDVCCNDKILNAKIHCNRAQLHFAMKNYGKCIEDCGHAICLDKSNIKAYYRAASASKSLGKFDQALQFCINGLTVVLTVDPSQPNLQKLHHECENLIFERKKKEEKTANSETLKLKAIYSRGITFSDPLFTMKACQSDLKSARLDLTTQELHWPVMFIYEEFQQSDYIEDVCERDTLLAHCEVMFPPHGQMLPWDTHGHYNIQNISIFAPTKPKPSTEFLETFLCQYTGHHDQ